MTLSRDEISVPPNVWDQLAVSCIPWLGGSALSGMYRSSITQRRLLPVD